MIVALVVALAVGALLIGFIGWLFGQVSNSTFFILVTGEVIGFVWIRYLLSL